MDGEDEQKEVDVRFVKRNLARVRGTKDWETFASTFPNMMEELQLSLTTLWLAVQDLDTWSPN